MIIYKYDVYPNTENQLNIPKGSVILHVGEGLNGWGEPHLECWVLQPNNWGEMSDHTIIVYGTGIHIPDNGQLKYINTCIDKSNFVWHSFERIDMVH